jgi:hypothetical protein
MADFMSANAGGHAYGISSTGSSPAPLPQDVGGYTAALADAFLNVLSASIAAIPTQAPCCYSNVFTTVGSDVDPGHGGTSYTNEFGVFQPTDVPQTGTYVLHVDFNVEQTAIFAAPAWTLWQVLQTDIASSLTTSGTIIALTPGRADARNTTAGFVDCSFRCLVKVAYTGSYGSIPSLTGAVKFQLQAKSDNPANQFRCTSNNSAQFLLSR